MKKLLKILTTIAAVLAAALFFAGCKQFLEDPEEFLGYWSSEVVPIDFSIDEPYQMSNDGALCIPSAHDVTLKIKLRNPRNFALIMPTADSDAGRIIRFPGLPSDQQPRYGIDYTLEKTAIDELKLIYKTDFLKKHEWSNGAIGPEITLISIDGRIFNKKFSMNLKADTAPSLEYKGVGKSSDNKYVLIFQVKNMDALLPSPFDHLHGDIKKLHITTEGGSSSDYTVTGINFTAKKINWESDSPFLANATQLVAGEYEGATPLFPAPTDKWLIYFKTNVEVSPLSALKTYEAWLSDGAGLFSNKVQGSTCIRKIGEIKVLENFPKQGGTGSNTTPYLINCVEDGVNLEVWCETPAEDVNILYWTYKQNPEQLIASASGEGTASPTNPLKTIRLPAPSAIGTTIKYKVTFKAIKPGFDPNEKTVYYKLTRVVGTVIDGNKADAWAKLKYAVERETEPEITIKNEIKAQDGSINIGGNIIGNDEQINVSREVKIKAFDENAAINADSKCRIFSVTSGTLKLNGLTLKKGKAPSSANGGGVYVSNSGRAELSGCAIENCTADLGGGIGASGHVKLTNTSIKTCEATSTTKGGGAVYAKGCTVELTGCTLKGNTARYSGGAIYAEKKDSTPSTVTISGGTIGGTDTNKNIAQNDGGGIWVGESCTLTMKDYAKVIGNKARNGSGGGIYAEGAIVNITNCTFKGNETDMNTHNRIGGAIYAKKTDSSLNKPSTVTISGGTIGGTDANDANKATGNGYYESGGGIWVGPECELTLEDNVQVIKNWAKKNGSGVYVQNASTKFTMKGSAKIDTNNNDVYLEEYDGGAKITVDGTLTPSGGIAARITVADGQYQESTQVLKGNIPQNYKKFEVTPKSGIPWYVASNGYLTLTQP